MKKLLLIILFFHSINSFSQINQRVDSIYYLMDKASTSSKGRLWKIVNDDQYKSYIIQCSCLKFDGQPTFIRSNNINGELITKRKFKTIRLTNLTNLIVKCKEYLNKDDDRKPYLFFLIQPQNKNYIIYDVDLINPSIQVVSGPDVIQTPPDTSGFKIKGVTVVSPKDITKYMNKLVISSGNIINTKVVENTNTVLLYIGTDHRNIDFIVLIANENRYKFDAPEYQFMGKLVKVIGKVATYEGTTVVVITDPNQIQIVKK